MQATKYRTVPRTHSDRHQDLLVGEAEIGMGHDDLWIGGAQVTISENFDCRSPETARALIVERLRALADKIEGTPIK